jgi:small subunit ribosomal protein S16
MAVRIRLRRMGAKKKPFYRVVVADSRSPRDGRFLDTIGWYDPVSNPVRFEIDADKAMRWLADGAEPTDSARSVLSQAGLMGRRGGPAGAAEPAAAGEEIPVAGSTAAGEGAAEAGSMAAGEGAVEAGSMAAGEGAVETGPTAAGEGAAEAAPAEAAEAGGQPEA